MRIFWARERAVAVLGFAYLMGAVGSLWDWRQHLVGPGTTQPPHLMVDLGGLLALAVLAFSGNVRLRSSSFVGVYVLLLLMAALILGPFALMMFFPRTSFTQGFMAWVMTRGGLTIYIPLLLLAFWAAWRWLRQGSMSMWRLAAAGGIAVVAVGSVIDLGWHQTHPMTAEMSMNMLTLPGHQIILAGFVLGALGSVTGLGLTPAAGVHTKEAA